MALVNPALSWPQSDSAARKGRRKVKWPTYARVAYYENRPRKVTVLVDHGRTSRYVERAEQDNTRWRRTENDRIYLAR